MNMSESTGESVPSESKRHDLPLLAPFRESNDLLALAGEARREALREAWERDGYWFFRSVIDRDAVGQMRAVYIEVLAELGLIEQGDEQAVWTGRNLDAVSGDYMMPLRAIAERAPWQAFLQQRAVVEFFQALLDEPAVWLPMMEMRAVPPGKPALEEVFVHQDGFYYNGALPILGVWFPLIDIPRDMGGLCILEGLHRGPFLHDTTCPPNYDIDWGKLPTDVWRSSEFGIGDVILFDQATPHCGLPNRSRQFRLSFDTRMVPASAQRPFVGTIVDHGVDHVTVDVGGWTTIPITDATYIRNNYSGRRLPREEFPVSFSKGDRVIVAVRDGMAALIREPHE